MSGSWNMLLFFCFSFIRSFQTRGDQLTNSSKPLSLTVALNINLAKLTVDATDPLNFVRECRQRDQRSWIFIAEFYRKCVLGMSMDQQTGPAVLFPYSFLTEDDSACARSVGVAKLALALFPLDFHDYGSILLLWMREGHDSGREWYGLANKFSGERCR